VAEVAERERASAQEQEDNQVSKVTLGPRLKAWAEEATGVKKGIRILISTLQDVLWSDAKWEPVPMAKLIDAKRVRIYFLKAVAIVHPDKHNTMDNEKKFVATQVFHYIETAYRVFADAELGGSS
jgi:hypothetical protein